MCVSSAPAELTGTQLYAGRDPVNAELQVLVYANVARNQAPGPNAMLLHFPAIPGTMSPASVLPTDGCHHIMEDMVEAARPKTRSMSLGAPGVGRGAVHVFESGIYTVVLAEYAGDIPRVLDQVRESRRPAISEELLAFYATEFPGFPVALCCFNNREAAQATPMMWLYAPLNPDVVFFPAIDCHTGGVPEFTGKVEVDHWLIGQGREPVTYGDIIPPQTRRHLPNAVSGYHLGGSMGNGDFVTVGGDVNNSRRVTPAELCALVY